MKNLFFLLMPLFALSCSAQNLVVSWTNGDNGTNATSTLVSYGISPGVYTNTITVPITQTNLVLTNLVGGQRYYVAAKHSDGTDLSDYSNEANAKTKPRPPKNIGVTPQ